MDLKYLHIPPGLAGVFRLLKDFGGIVCHLSERNN